DMGAIASAFVEIAAAQALLPQSLTLHQTSPDPFNPVTTIHYDLPERTSVRLAIYDVMGREVAVLADAVREPGVGEIQWNAAAQASGIYFYQLQTSSQTITRKLVVLK
ncbi:MAG: T9SS type A sorting domain-containing protein, partial [Candidatus Marinimicrobia bacterium]|nr:T9SS type A sorting domain-containing protein [Candidatus Neomarinimicrobiota bacterium]